MTPKGVIDDIDEKGINHGWMPIRLILLLQQHMPVHGNSDIQVEVWIKLQDTNSSAFVQNQTRSSSVQSKANAIIGNGAAFTIQRNTSGAFLPSLSLHITITTYNRSVSTLDSDALLMSSTCCLPRGRYVQSTPIPN